MVRENRITPLLLCSLLLLFAACKSSKQAVKESPLLGDISELQIMSPAEPYITAKMKLSAAMGEKSVSAGGTMRIEQGAGVELGVTALGLFEVARLEISPVDAQLINKIGKEYASVAYDNVGFLARSGLTYPILESVFMNKPFSPDGRPFADALSQMQITKNGDEYLIITPEYKKMRYTFCVNAVTGELVRTVGVYNNSVTVDCLYSDFEKFGSTVFPRTIRLSVAGVGQDISLELKLSNLRNGKFSFKKSNTSSYKNISVDNLLKSINQPRQ